MALAVNECGPAVSEHVLGYMNPDDPVEDGDLVPVITLALRPAPKKEGG